MKIAVPYENGQVFQHFGHSGQFKIYDVEDGRIAAERIADPAGSGHGALAGFLSGLEVDTLICGGIGAGAQEALAQAGIRLYGGVTGGADEAVRALLAGTLNYSAEVRCSRHDHHGERGHCGEDHHGCAGNSGRCGG
ncbi:NifB/NifX family molybdenum-iron cluster-binding protein [uncultured Oscillibacter sp.]|uniref:NifB/NifX family molybdenum-iron cluster-binding protein n=1 Tax=uncultured Oscillibacter sp. TaxID=876091 RepID=UPI00261F4389|nr:NifB/NifX family molybdenum-iron cluster-binding protein [uncultured Oscillibacter sp.]